MCGISVIVNQYPSKVSPDLLKKMNDRIKHRGPDGEGFFIENNVGLGHRMLKITDLSESNVQPMHFKDYVITYNGEIYNYRLLKKELQKSGYYFATDTDTEIILAAYDKWQEECIHRFNGMWSFVIFDRKRNKLFCSRDRFGIKPFCYTIFEQQLFLASEAKQFLSIDNFQLRMNSRITYAFLVDANMDASEETFFENVNNLPAGHNLHYDLNTHSLRIDRWYNLNPAVSSNSISFQDATYYFNELFSEVVSDHLHSMVPVGSCLSGGIDSTVMVALAKKNSTNISTFSSCFLSSQANEINYIDAAVNYYQVTNKKVFPDINELLDDNSLRKMVYYQDQPISSGSFFSEYKVFEAVANEKVKVILSGQGADEYLAGYSEGYYIYMKSLLKKGEFINFFSELVNLKANENFSRSTFLKNFLAQFQSLQNLKRAFINPSGLPSVRLSILNTNWRKTIEADISDSERKNYKDLRDISIDATLNYSLPHQLHSEDRNSMLHSIESRVPFLDHRLVEFCISLPDSFKIKNGARKVILREAFKNLLPPEIYNRHWKLGFPGPEEPLFTNNSEEIKQLFKKQVDEFPQIFSPNLLTYYQSYLDKKTPYDSIFFRVLSFGTWAKQFNLASTFKYLKKASVISSLIEPFMMI